MANLSIKIDCIKKNGETSAIFDCCLTRSEALYVMYNVVSSKNITKDKNGKITNITTSYSVEGKKIILASVYSKPIDENGVKFKRLFEVKGKDFYIYLKRSISSFVEGADTIKTLFIME
jgi:hypothetical protein